MPSPSPSEEDRNPSEDEDEDGDDDGDGDGDDSDEEETAAAPVEEEELNKNGAIYSASTLSSSSDNSHPHKPSSSPLLPVNSSSGKRPSGELSPKNKRPRINDRGEAADTAVEPEKKVLDDSRKLFQRLWTDEAEIGLLNGFLEYSRKGTSNFYDMTPFYDQIKVSLNLEFNKNQLVEKLRRLKKKYRNVVSKIDSGKEFSFKSPHDQETFEISRKIWSGVKKEVDEEAEEGNTNSYHNDNIIIENKTPKTVKRSQKVACVSDPLTSNHHQPSSSFQTVVEETARYCLSPVFKELLLCAMNGSSSSGYGVTPNVLPLNFGSPSTAVNLLKSGVPMDEKWRKQQILELEVYLKRLELLQDQIKSTLEELKSVGS